MRQKFYSLLLLILSYSCAFAQTNIQTTYQRENHSNVVSDDWYSKATASIEKLSYDFSLINNASKNFSVINNKQKLGFFTTSNGYEAQNIKTSPDDKVWKVNFQLASISKDKGDAIFPAHFKEQINGNTLVYSSDEVDVQYINTPEGLRQNFIIKKLLKGFGKLKLAINLESDLIAQCINNEKVIFHSKTDAKDVKLIYRDLKVWDANNKVLNAFMSIEKNANVLELIVDDKNATYPLTIDPINQSAEWSSSAEGLVPGLLNTMQLKVGALYGYTVAGLGDINGDGYDDVAIGAPTMADVIVTGGAPNLAAVGAVFVFYGSATGLLSAPSKILQPTTIAAGALFGISIEAGDIVGDAKRDIVIGAPMDSYTTTASTGLTFPLSPTTNVTVNAGKVYIYNGSDISLPTTNPSPLVQVKLDGASNFSTGLLGVLNSNVTVKSLFGYSLALANDLNADGKADLIVGSPSYVGTNLLSVQNGAAFVFYSNNLNTATPVSLKPPSPTLLGLPLLPVANTAGLLFGFSVDGIGDYNSDGFQDVVVGAPAGADLSSLGGVFTGQMLAGSAYIYYGTNTGINTTNAVRLQASSSGLLSNTANLFGYKVKGLTTANGVRNGNLLVGAPLGSVISKMVGGLEINAGNVHVFVKKASPAVAETSTQVISSPRATNILSVVGGTLNTSLLLGLSMDNMLDVNCDGINDIIVGEPLSSAVTAIMPSMDAVGGSAYIFTGRLDGTFNTAEFWEMHHMVEPFLGVNATSLTGFSVAGAKYVMGKSHGVRALIGNPSNTLDFGAGLLNLGNTVGTLMNFGFDDGSTSGAMGDADVFPFPSCINILPLLMLEFSGLKIANSVQLKWTTVDEINVDHFELERSIDAGNSYTKIAIINANGKSSKNNYEYIDASPNTGMNCYRLKIMDEDGTFEYSEIFKTDFNNQVSSNIVVAPNPVSENIIKLQLMGVAAGNYRLEMINVAGQTLQTKSVKVVQLNQQETITTSAMLPSGIYLLNLYTDAHVKIKTVRVFMNNE